MKSQENIIALATPPGTGAIAVFRLSGNDVIDLTDRFFRSASGKSLKEAKGHTLHFGTLYDGDELIDEVLVSVFRSPKSYTGENAVEISVHASPYIQQRVLEWFLRHGVRLAEPGEFTLRAFMHGKMDLAQAEAVADLIAADNRWAHKAALQQLRGGFSKELKDLRVKLVEFASLIELELDFAEEDVEFANREDLKILLSEIKKVLKNLIDSFKTGNVIKNGIPVAIVGAPNAGKSTLLNALLNEEKAIVTEIPGTTRDAIEDELILEGVKFRFTDTAGIRHTDDPVERLGIERTFEKMKQAQIVFLLIDTVKVKNVNEIETEINQIKKQFPEIRLVILLNKTDLADKAFVLSLENELKSSGRTVFPISAKQKKGLDQLKDFLVQQVEIGGLTSGQTVVTNVRHWEALRRTLNAIEQVEEGLAAGLSGDLLAVDLRDALHSLGEITGDITTDDLLDHIFMNFCIGK